MIMLSKKTMNKRINNNMMEIMKNNMMNNNMIVVKHKILHYVCCLPNTCTLTTQMRKVQLIIKLKWNCEIVSIVIS